MIHVKESEDSSVKSLPLLATMDISAKPGNRFLKKEAANPHFD